MKLQSKITSSILYFLLLLFFKCSCSGRPRQSRSVHHDAFWVFNMTKSPGVSSETLKQLKIATNGYCKQCKMLPYSQAVFYHWPQVKKYIQSRVIQKILRYRKNFILDFNFCDDGVSTLEAVWGQFKVHVRSDEAINFMSHSQRKFSVKNLIQKTYNQQVWEQKNKYNSEICSPWRSVCHHES